MHQLLYITPTLPTEIFYNKLFLFASQKGLIREKGSMTVLSPAIQESGHHEDNTVQVHLLWKGDKTWLPNPDTFPPGIPSRHCRAGQAAQV